MADDEQAVVVPDEPVPKTAKAKSQRDELTEELDEVLDHARKVGRAYMKQGLAFIHELLGEAEVQPRKKPRRKMR